MHTFYFFDPEHQFLLRLEVPLHTPKNTELHLADIKDFTASTEWLGFAKVSAEKQKVVLTWFNRVVRPALAYNPLKNK